MKDINFEKIGQKLKKIRISKGLTQEYIANMVDVNTSHISNIENNRVKVSLSTLLQICNALGVTVDYVLSAPGLQRQDKGADPSDHQGFEIDLSPARHSAIRPAPYLKPLINPALSAMSATAKSSSRYSSSSLQSTSSFFPSKSSMISLSTTRRTVSLPSEFRTQASYISLILSSIISTGRHAASPPFFTAPVYCTHVTSFVVLPIKVKKSEGSALFPSVPRAEKSTGVSRPVLSRYHCIFTYFRDFFLKPHLKPFIMSRLRNVKSRRSVCKK